MRLPIPKDLIINFAGMVFIGCTLFVAWSGQQMSQLVSFTGMVFILAGVLLSSALIGMPINRLHRHYSIGMVNNNNGELNDSIVQKIRFSGTALMIAQVIAIYYLTVLAFQHFFG